MGGCGGGTGEAGGCTLGSMTNVVRFPPLAPIVAPFSGPLDPRQETFYRIIGNLGRMLVEHQGGTVEATDTITGYRASAVDVGHLQELLETGLAAFGMDDLRERWDVDLFDWCLDALRGWVQRRKYLKMTLEDNGIHIAMETQDDRGYYSYEFDVFPGKGRSNPRPPTHL